MKIIPLITEYLRVIIQKYPKEDQILFNNKLIELKKDNFQILTPQLGEAYKSICFIDGGEAEILKAGNFSLSFIRVAAICFNNNKKKFSHKKEFFLLTTSTVQNEEVYFQSKIFGDKLIDESDLFVSSRDETIRQGLERAAPSKIASQARRFAELSLAINIESISSKKPDFIVLDGNLESTYKNEDKYISRLPTHTSALAKTSNLFTINGNSPNAFLKERAPSGCWSYSLDENNSFVNLSSRAQHVFRFSGNQSVLPCLLDNCSDSTFLGYPYGLILVDQLARISNNEKSLIKSKILLDKKNSSFLSYLNTANAHDILDRMG